MKLLLRGAAQIIAPHASARGADIIADKALLVEDERIAQIGAEAELRAQHPAAEIMDCAGAVITPGLIDSHTHAVFGAWRAGEYALRARGVSYMEIARQGGGINASVRDVRARSESDLVEHTRRHLDEMLRAGVTTAEVKSGYGLSTDAELRMLRVIRALQGAHAVDIVPTFLGAHEFPEEYRDRRDAYVDLIVHEMIPRVAAETLATFCDVFMEPGVFDATQTRRILEAGAAHGLLPKLHADEFESSGAAELAAALGAVSADHLGAISDAGIAALAASQTVATLLPATLLFLGKKQYAPARRLIDAGAVVALATDFNPGTAPSTSMQVVMMLACSQMGMDPLEAITAATAGGARALRLDDGRGTLQAGAPADLVLWDAADYREIPYRFGRSLVRQVLKRGKPQL